MDKLRILFLIPNFTKGGAERFLIDLCTELSNHPSIEFIVGTLTEGNEYEDLTKDFKIVSLNYQTFSFSGKNECLAYKKLLLDYKPHIIHTHLFLAEFLSSYYVDSNIKYVCHGHDNMRQFQRFNVSMLFNKEKLTEYLERRHLIKHKYSKVATHFIANSKHTEIYYRKNLSQVPNTEVSLIQYGFNYQKFEQRIQPKDFKKGSTIKILNVGSFQKKKNQKFIVEIATILKQNKDYNFEFNLIGAGEEFENVQNQINEKELSEIVKLRGLIDNVEDWYKETDIYLHVATYEPFGLVFLEAMAAGAPVISLDGKGNSDLIKNQENGIIIDEQDAQVFTDKILSILENDNLRNKIVVQAQKDACMFSIEKKVGELLKVYDKDFKN